MEKMVNDNIILIGTAHVSKKSVAEVRAAIEKYEPDIVAVELDDKRYEAITKKNRWQKTSVIDVIKSGKGFLLLVQTFLAMIQRKLGKEFGVEPGSEMIAAIKEAKKHGIKIALVDRDITITFKRAWRLMTAREKLRIFWYSMKALIGYDRLEEEMEEELEQKIEEKRKEVKEAKAKNETKKVTKADKKTGQKKKVNGDKVSAQTTVEPLEKGLGRKSKKEKKSSASEETSKKASKDKRFSKEASLEKLMDEDVISAMMNELREVVPNATNALIDERDQYISKKIIGYVNGTEKKFVKFKSKPSSPDKAQVKKKKKKTDKNRVLAVIGAGHLSGIKKNLSKPEKLPKLKTLEKVPKKRISVMKTIGYLIPILFFSLFAYLAIFGEWEKLMHVLLAWFLINGICSAIGAALALGHPLSIITAFFAAPITSLNPTIGAGWVAGYVEVKVRTPTVEDIRALSTIETIKDFLRNKVVRVLMVMALANLGSTVGTIIAGYYIGSVTLPSLF